MTRRTPKPKAVKVYGGFTNGRLHSVLVDMGWGGFGRGDLVAVPAIFRTRKSAREKYEDVRPVLITPIPKRKKP
jgi:hypothetical protein